MKIAVAEKLASAQGRRDEAPNIKLAEELVQARERQAIQDLAALLETGKSDQQSDAIKVLYEIGARSPDLISPHTALFVRQLEHGNNRMVWGALTALAHIATVEPDIVAASLDDILTAADAGSVIAKDQAVQILIVLKKHPQTESVAASLLLDRLEAAATNQFPMYAERIAPVMEANEYPRFRTILTRRLDASMPESKRRRIEKVLAKLG